MSIIPYGDTIRPVDKHLWLAIGNGDEALVQILLDRQGDRANPSARNLEKQTALHLAVADGHDRIVRLLLEKGVEVEAAGDDGEKPLYIAAGLGNRAIVTLLLQHSANVESFNVKKQLSALFKAVENGHKEVAKVLLQHGADVNLRNANGETSLFDSVVKGNKELTTLLLQSGASKDIRSNDGRSVVGIATGDADMMNVLQKTYVLQGPSTAAEKAGGESRFFQIPTPPSMENQIDEVNACQGFEMTIVDFSVGAHERRVVNKVPIWDVLYGRGPEIIMNPGRESLLAEEGCTFGWYHFPANNMAWVEALVSRLLAERNSGAAMLTAEFKASLGLTNAAGQQYQTATAQSSFMRPLCRFVKSGEETSFSTGSGDHVMLFMPFLHFEYHSDYKKMSKIISEVRNLTDRGRRWERSQNRPTYTRFNRRHLSIETLERFRLDYEIDPDPNYVVVKRWVNEEEQDFLWAHTKQIRERRRPVLLAIEGKKKGREAEFDLVQKTQRRSKTGRVKENSKEELHHTLDGNGELRIVKRRHARTSFRRQLYSEAKHSLKAAAKFLGGGGASEPSESDSDDSLYSESSYTSDEISLPEKDTHDEVKKILLGSERLTAAFQELKDKLKGNTEDGERTKESENKELDVTKENSECLTNDHGFAVSTDETRMGLRRAMTDLKENLDLRTEKYQRDRKEKSIEVDKSRNVIPIVTNTRATAPQSTKKHEDEGQVSSATQTRHEGSTTTRPSSTEGDFLESSSQLTPTPLLTFLEGKPRASVKDNNRSPHLLPDHSKPTSDLSPREDHSSKPIEECSDEALTTKSASNKIFGLSSQGETVPSNNTVQVKAMIQNEEVHSGNAKKNDSPVRSKIPILESPKTQIKTEVPNKSRSQKEQRNPPHLAESPSRMTVDLLNEHLIKGYLFPSAGQLPFLQPRRTLDQYFYTHLENTSDRDSDQVVYRYTKTRNMSPKMFMVDQLWLWILNEDTVISCCPQRWQSWSESVSADANPENPLVALPNDPLNVHQMILEYIQQPIRAPITSAYDLANLITDSCASVFDPFRIPDEFQFLDFFERSIGTVSDNEATCFKNFTQSLAHPPPHDSESDPRFNITKETNLLVEIKDIRDELSILKMVLNHQASTMADLSHICAFVKAGKPTAALELVEKETVTQHRVLENHLWRITRMDELSEKTYQSLNHLIELKHKQASMSEAISARKQAENTFRQAENTARQAEYAATQADNTAEQARIGAEEAAETARQGKTILVFTVVTIIFLPLSFMAAFFAIAIESFPFNDNGKLALGYVLKYMLSVSGAVSIPFILIAFNQDRIVRWLEAIGGLISQYFPQSLRTRGLRRWFRRRDDELSFTDSRSINDIDYGNGRR